MILNGECGAFNRCCSTACRRSACASRSALPTLAADQVLRRDAKRLSAELLQKSAVPHSDRAQRELNYVKEKLDFFVSCCGDVQFEYDVPAGTIIIADRSRPRQQQCTILDVHETDSLRLLRPADIARLRAALRPQRPRTTSFRSACFCRSGASSTGTISGCTRSGRRSPRSLCRRDRLSD